MFSIDWHLAIAVNVVFPLMLAATITFRYYSTRAYRRTRERMAHVTAFVAESLSGMRVMQAFAAIRARNACDAQDVACCGAPWPALAAETGGMAA